MGEQKHSPGPCDDPIGCTAVCHDDDGVRYCNICGRFEGCRIEGKTPSMIAAKARAKATTHPSSAKGEGNA